MNDGTHDDLGVSPVLRAFEIMDLARTLDALEPIRTDHWTAYPDLRHVHFGPTIHDMTTDLW